MREKDSISGGGAEREGDTESEAGSRLWAVSTGPNTGLKLMKCEIMTWAEVGYLIDWATQVPQYTWENLKHEHNHVPALMLFIQIPTLGLTCSLMI